MSFLLPLLSPSAPAVTRDVEEPSAPAAGRRGLKLAGRLMLHTAAAAMCESAAGAPRRGACSRTCCPQPADGAVGRQAASRRRGTPDLSVVRSERCCRSPRGAVPLHVLGSPFGRRCVGSSRQSLRNACCGSRCFCPAGGCPDTTRVEPQGRRYADPSIIRGRERGRPRTVAQDPLVRLILRRARVGELSRRPCRAPSVLAAPTRYRPQGSTSRRSCC
jgi:hypothetical protein